MPLEGGRGKLAEGSWKGPGAEVRERRSAWVGGLRGVHRAPPVPPALYYIHTRAHPHTHNHTGTQLTAQHTHSEKHTQPQKHTNTDTEPPPPKHGCAHTHPDPVQPGRQIWERKKSRCTESLLWAWHAEGTFNPYLIFTKQY